MPIKNHEYYTRIRNIALNQVAPILEEYYGFTERLTMQFIDFIGEKYDQGYDFENLFSIMKEHYTYTLNGLKKYNKHNDYRVVPYVALGIACRIYDHLGYKRTPIE